MSKSKGNVLDPIDLIDGIDIESLVKKRVSGLMRPQDAPKIEKATRDEFPNGISAFGTDALRFTFAALASTGRDINFDLARIEGYRNFCNKLWNAARYVLMNTEGQDTGTQDGDMQLSLPDRWILTRLQETTRQVHEAVEHYRLDHAAQAIYEFLWNGYCDWYLELTKSVLNSPGGNTAPAFVPGGTASRSTLPPSLAVDSTPAQQRGTRHTLVHVLERALCLAHPIMPFITEEIWQRVAPLAGASGDTIMLRAYPRVDATLIDARAATDMDWIMNFVLGVRKIRSGMNIAPSKPLPVLLQNGSAEDQRLLTENRNFVVALARIDTITWLDAAAQPPESATALVGELKVLIPMAGLIDKNAELTRLTKEMDRLSGEVERIGAKLANPSFADKAPAPVVDKERAKLNEAQSALTKLRDQHARITAM